MICDLCGERDAIVTSVNEDSDIEIVASDLNEAVEYFNDNGWTISKDGQASYCPDCDGG
jgi:hypothetical protein